MDDEKLSRLLEAVENMNINLERINHALDGIVDEMRGLNTMLEK